MQSKYYQENKVKIDKNNKIWRNNNPEKMKALSSRQHKKYREFSKEKYLLSAAKRRAKIFNLEFNLVHTDIIIPEFCPIFNILLSWNKDDSMDFRPSIDRIDPLKGYIKGNICVISLGANRKKQNSTVEELEAIIAYMKKYKEI